MNIYRVLIVEDELIIRNGIVSLIDWQALRCEVVGECQNGREASEFLERHDVDMVVTDILMPGMNGLELLREIGARHAHVLTIILTAYANFAYAQEAMKLGAGDYVVKANFVSELPKAVARAVLRLDARSVPPQDRVRELALRSILQGEITGGESIRQWLETCAICLLDFYVVLVEAGELDAAMREAVMRLYKRACAGHKCTAYWHADGLLLAIMEVDGEGGGDPMIGAILDELRSVCCYTPFELRFGVSQRHSSGAALGDAYSEALSALSRPHPPDADADPAAPSDSDNEFVLFINEFINAHYDETIKLSDLADMLHVNISHLSRLYKRLTGDSIINTLNALRVERAKAFLANSDHRISQVGGMVGIDDPAYFSSVFSKYTGLSPKQYRRHMLRARADGGPPRNR